MVDNNVDLTAWTVTPDPVYYANPWITAGSLSEGYSWNNSNWIGACTASNQFDQFPLTVYDVSGIQTAPRWNSSYWEPESDLIEPPLEVTTPYLEGDLFALDCSTQSADVLWIFHPSYPPAVIARLGPNLWQYSLSLPGQDPSEPPYRGTLDVVKTGYSALGQSIALISQASPAVLVLASSSPTAPFAVGNRIYIN